MAEMRNPQTGAVINVREESVERYASAGYTTVESETKSTAKKASSSKTKK